MNNDLLARVQSENPPPFALLYRPESGVPGAVEVLTGDVWHDALLEDVPSADSDVLVVVPYRQIAERGFAAPDDEAPLITMTITHRETVRLADVLVRIPDVPTTLSGGHFDVSDERYAETVRRVIADEIGSGAGANFVIKRSFRADIENYTPACALSFFRRLLEREQGAYWTFLVHTGDRTFVGATPERHISVREGTAVMNPISGTYRYPSTGPTLAGVNQFLADRKEADELYMVVDEELKMMARICDDGGRVVGPYLKEMARLAHTEYLIEGRTDRDPREILRETMFAPTVTGSPLESACRVINRYEPEGRGYYSGMVALIERSTLDSAILIRTADIDAAGGLRIGVGATLVRHSDPESEVAETRAKAAGLLNALEAAGGTRFGAHPDVRETLRRRNDGIADFWLRQRGMNDTAALVGKRALVVDAEDNFTAMIGHQLRSLGLAVRICRFDEVFDLDGHDVVVLGPGPGDPCAESDRKIRRLTMAVDRLLETHRPFVAVCLSHQVLSRHLGFQIARLPVPNQGTQREIELFGKREKVGFYNTFAAFSEHDKQLVDGLGVVEVSRDERTGEVHAVRGPGFASMQFHAESILTVDGPRILGDAIAEALA